MKLQAAALALLTLVPLSAGAADEGARLYATRCASCHGENGQGSNVAPSLIGKPAADIHLMLDTGRMPASVPGANDIERPASFTHAQIAQIVRYVLHFSPGTDTSLPSITLGNVHRGRKLFVENCAPCHGAAGDGASAGYANVAPSLLDATAFEVAEAVRAGPGVMPRFGADVLSEQDVSDIARYVTFIQTQSGQPDNGDAGGLPLGHVGPVAEGFVAWLFGIGLLVLFVRRIGTAGG